MRFRSEDSFFLMISDLRIAPFLMRSDFSSSLLDTSNQFDLSRLTLFLDWRELSNVLFLGPPNTTISKIEIARVSWSRSPIPTCTIVSARSQTDSSPASLLSSKRSTQACWLTASRLQSSSKSWCRHLWTATVCFGASRSPRFWFLFFFSWSFVHSLPVPCWLTTTTWLLALMRKHSHIFITPIRCSRNFQATCPSNPRRPVLKGSGWRWEWWDHQRIMSWAETDFSKRHLRV